MWQFFHYNCYVICCVIHPPLDESLQKKVGCLLLGYILWKIFFFWQLDMTLIRFCHVFVSNFANAQFVPEYSDWSFTLAHTHKHVTKGTKFSTKRVFFQHTWVNISNMHIHLSYSFLLPSHALDCLTMLACIDYFHNHPTVFLCLFSCIPGKTECSGYVVL